MQGIQYKNACIKYDTDNDYRKEMVRGNVSCVFVSCQLIMSLEHKWASMFLVCAVVKFENLCKKVSKHDFFY